MMSSKIVLIMVVRLMVEVVSMGVMTASEELVLMGQEVYIMILLLETL